MITPAPYRNRIQRAGYLLTFFLMVLIFCANAMAADKSLDSLSFPGSKMATDFDNLNDWSRAMAIQPDGKIVVAGYSENAPYEGDFAVARYNTDGSLDTSFGGDGRVTTDFDSGNDHGNGVAIQPDGKIVVAGYSGSWGANDFAVACYNTDGSLDTSFDGDGRVTTDFGSESSQGNGIAIQPDGKIVVAGSCQGFAVARYNADGSMDTSFGGTGMVTTVIGYDYGYDFGNAVAIQPDGKIIVAGSSQSCLNSDVTLARYNIDGTLDTSFDDNGIMTPNDDLIASRAVSPPARIDRLATWTVCESHAIALQTDGKIVVVGGCSYNNPSSDSSCFMMTRYSIDGSPDTTFSEDGTVTLLDTLKDPGQAVAIQSDGKIVVAGPPSSSDFGVVRFNIDGSLDSSFNDGGTDGGDNNGRGGGGGGCFINAINGHSGDAHDFMRFK